MINPHSGRDDASDASPVGRKFHIDSEETAGAIVLSVHGDVDMLTAPRINEAVLDAVALDPRVVIVDLSDVDFLASAGMTALVTAQQQVVPGAQFLVVADGRGTSRPLKLMGIDAALPLHRTLAEALAACQ